MISLNVKSCRILFFILDSITMKKYLLPLWIILLIALWIWWIYNSMVSAQETVKSTWWQVENQYQRRLDLIDNLVETVRWFAWQELEVLTQVTEARARATSTTINIEDAQQFEAFQQNQGELWSALSRLLVAVEAYPELKSDQNFLELQAQLEWTENRIATARNDYLLKLASYNRTVRTMPNVLIARLFWFFPIEYFEADQWAERAPRVNFGS